MILATLKNALIIFLVLCIPASAAVYVLNPPYDDSKRPSPESGYVVDYVTPAAGLDPRKNGIDILYKDKAPDEWQAMLAYAKQAWNNQEPACGYQNIILATMTPQAADVGATGELNGCRIWISVRNIDEYSPRGRCKLVAHEYGHLLGNEHTKQGLMADSAKIYQAKVPACDQFPD